MRKTMAGVSLSAFFFSYSLLLVSPSNKCRAGTPDVAAIIQYLNRLQQNLTSAGEWIVKTSAGMEFGCGC